MTRRSSVFLLGFVAATSTVSAESIVRTLDPALSPDGSTIAFSWQGDLWSVSANGGTARRLTVHPADDTYARWSPDGSRIFFASNRAGSIDVYCMRADGTNLSRVTYESGSEYPGCVTKEGYVYGHTNTFGRSDLFRVKTTGGDCVRLTGHPYEMEFSPTVSPSGGRLVYNTSGSSGNWRKPGHSGANTARLWIDDIHEASLAGAMVIPGDRNDLFAQFVDENRVVFVSNRSGAPNLWTVGTNGQGLRQLTRFTDGTIRSLSVVPGQSNYVFQKDSRVWSFDATKGEATPVDIQAPSDSVRDAVQELNLATGAQAVSVSPNGKRAVIAMRGDLFLIPERGGTTRRLTTSARYDGQPAWLDDSTVVYTSAGTASQRSLKKVTIDGKVSDFLADSLDLTCPVPSPDRKWVAFHRGDREIVVVPAAGGAVNVVAEGDFSEALSGSRSFNWAPDSQWLVYRTALERGLEVVAVKADASQRVKVAAVGKSCGLPVFTADSRAVVFSATEGVGYSETRDSASPLVVVDLVPLPVTYREDDLDKIDAPKEEASKDVSVRIVERGLKSRRRVLSAGDAGTVWPAADGKSVYTNIAGQFSIVDVRTGAARPVTGITGSASGVEWAANRSKFYFIQDGKPSAYTVAGGSVSPMAFSAAYSVDQRQEEAALFDEVWWAMSRLYYNPKMNGKDWTGIRERFGKIVPLVQSREDFYALMGEMMELLDSSHLGATAPPGWRAANPDDVAWLGVDFDSEPLAARGSFIVSKVYEGTPAALPESELRPGDRIVTVDGQRPGVDAPLAQLMNRKAGRKVVLEIDREGKPLKVTIQPSRWSSRTGVMYDDWVEGNRAMIDRLSGGILGYIHIQSMDVGSLDVFLREIQTELNGKTGVILDVRYNGGGFTSHIILNVMLKQPWLIRTTRDRPGVELSENNFRGNALELPAACLANQYSFSNAEIFSEGMRRLKLGPVIGEPTAGGVIGTGGYGLWDGGFIRMPGSGAYAVDGENLEQNGRKPDIDVRWDPNLWNQGRDPMIEVAVKELLKRTKS